MPRCAPRRRPALALIFPLFLWTGAVGCADLLPGAAPAGEASGRDVARADSTSEPGEGTRPQPDRRSRRTRSGAARVTPSVAPSGATATDRDTVRPLRPPSAAERAVADMRADLTRLVAAQAEYLANQGRYSRRLSKLTVRYLAHDGVVIQMLEADSDSWAARATHRSLPGRSCVIWVGAASPRPRTDAAALIGGVDGAPVCDPV